MLCFQILICHLLCITRLLSRVETISSDSRLQVLCVTSPLFTSCLNMTNMDNAELLIRS